MLKDSLHSTHRCSTVAKGVAGSKLACCVTTAGNLWAAFSESLHARMIRSPTTPWQTK